MATVTKNLYFSGDGFVIDVDYDNVALTILTIHLINNSARNYTIITTTTNNNQKTYTLNVPTATTIDQNIPQNQANKLGVTIDAQGRFDGVEWSVF